MERAPRRHCEITTVHIKPGVIEKYKARTGVSDIGEAESLLRADLSQASPVRLNPKDIPENFRIQKKGTVSYVADPNNPQVVYQLVSRKDTVTVEGVLNFGIKGTKAGRARY